VAGESPIRAPDQAGGQQESSPRPMRGSFASSSSSSLASALVPPAASPIPTVVSPNKGRGRDGGSVVLFEEARKSASPKKTPAAVNVGGGGGAPNGGHASSSSPSKATRPGGGGGISAPSSSSSPSQKSMSAASSSGKMGTAGRGSVRSSGGGGGLFSPGKRVETMISRSSPKKQGKASRSVEIDHERKSPRRCVFKCSRICVSWLHATCVCTVLSTMPRACSAGRIENPQPTVEILSAPLPHSV